MANMGDKFFNLGMMIGNGIAARQREAELTKALRKAFGLDGNSNTSGNIAQQKQQGDNNYKFDYNNIMGTGTGNAGLDKLLSMQGQPQQTPPNQQTAPQFNAGADYGVDLMNPYSMQIMNAKNDYARAQKLGDEQAMLRANSVAEQARAAAQEAGVPIQSFLSSNNVDYGQAFRMNDQLRAAQEAGNKNFSYEDLLNGTIPNQQTANPTQGIVAQSPVNAGTAVATPAQGVTTPTVGNQQTAQTPNAVSLEQMKKDFNQYVNNQTGGAASPFLGRGRLMF